tara:strand:+ start:166 stop:372 length:207 start_codon:yes stop_codon:yes gene_type:complete
MLILLIFFASTLYIKALLLIISCCGRQKGWKTTQREPFWAKWQKLAKPLENACISADVGRMSADFYRK